MNNLESTAFGMTETSSGFNEALRTVFSLLKLKKGSSELGAVDLRLFWIFSGIWPLRGKGVNC